MTAGKATGSIAKAGKFKLTIKIRKKAKALLKKAKSSVRATLQTTATTTPATGRRGARRR